MNVRAGAILGSALALAACGSVADQPGAPAAQPPSPQARCETALAQMPSSEHARLVAVFESTALEIAGWQESGLMPGHARAGQGQSPMRRHAFSESVASCYFDGDFTWRGPIPPPQPGASPAAPQTFERLLMIIDSTGNGIGTLGGSKEILPLVRPAA